MSPLPGFSFLSYTENSTILPMANVSKPEMIATDLRSMSAITLCTLSSMVLLIACLLVFLQYCGAGSSSLLDVRTSSVLFLLGGLLAVITCVSAVKSAMIVYRIYMSVIAINFGLIFPAAGAYLFFDDIPYYALQDGDTKKRQEVGNHLGNMGVIIWLVTIPLIGIEFFLVVAKLKGDHTVFYTFYTAVALLQKLTQAGLYYFYIRRRYPLIKCPSVARCYFEIVSFLNFVYWVDSIVLTHEDDSYITSVYGNSFWILKSAYNALIIDYRLMCCLIFLEHAIEIRLQHSVPQNIRAISSVDMEQLDDASLNDRIVDIEGTARMPYDFSRRIPPYRGLGYLTGLLLCGIQIFNGLQYMSFIGSWSSLTVIINDLFIFVAGTYFVFVNKLEITGKWRKSDSVGIDATVGIMGGIAFAFWVLKALLTVNLTIIHRQSPHYNYMIMTSTKNCFRAANAIFLLYLFVRVPSNICAIRVNRSKIINHFLVPALTLSILAVFGSAIADEYNGTCEKLLEHAKVDSAVRFFLKAGAPIHLGFCLHMCLHFLIIRGSMTTAKARIKYTSEHNETPEDDRSNTIADIERFWSRTPTPLREPLLARAFSAESEECNKNRSQ